MSEASTLPRGHHLEGAGAAWAGAECGAPRGRGSKRGHGSWGSGASNAGSCTGLAVRRKGRQQLRPNGERRASSQSGCRGLARNREGRGGRRRRFGHRGQDRTGSGPHGVAQLRARLPQAREARATRPRLLLARHFLPPRRWWVGRGDRAGEAAGEWEAWRTVRKLDDPPHLYPECRNSPPSSVPSTQRPLKDRKTRCMHDPLSPYLSRKQVLRPWQRRNKNPTRKPPETKPPTPNKGKNGGAPEPTKNNVLPGHGLTLRAAAVSATPTAGAAQQDTLQECVLGRALLSQARLCERVAAERGPEDNQALLVGWQGQVAHPAGVFAGPEGVDARWPHAAGVPSASLPQVNLDAGMRLQTRRCLSRPSKACKSRPALTADHGAAHVVEQGEGGEQGDPLMPGLFALTQHPALQATQAMLLPGEVLFAFLGDICILSRPGRAHAIFDILHAKEPAKTDEASP